MFPFKNLYLCKIMNLYAKSNSNYGDMYILDLTTCFVLQKLIPQKTHS